METVEQCECECASECDEEMVAVYNDYVVIHNKVYSALPDDCKVDLGTPIFDWDLWRMTPEAIKMFKIVALEIANLADDEDLENAEVDFAKDGRIFFRTAVMHSSRVHYTTQAVAIDVSWLSHTERQHMWNGIGCMMVGTPVKYRMSSTVNATGGSDTCGHLVWVN